MSSAALLHMSEIQKSFGPTQALKGVSLSISAGEVVALIGENGAGKSTVLKILSGAHTADSGSIAIEGQPFQPKSPQDARLAGIAMIYQELNLAPDLSVEDNIMLGMELRSGGFLNRKRQREIVGEAMRKVGLDGLDPKTIVKHLSVANRQLVEIARALAFNAKIILFDEPTSSLPQDDVHRLFEIVKMLRDSGLGVVYISHFLEEVREVADRIVVIRDGENAGHGDINDLTNDQVISMMVGRDVENLFPTVPHKLGEERLRIENLSGEVSPQNVDLSLRRGEIFGVAGLVGAGRTELLRCMFGLDPSTKSAFDLDGKRLGDDPKTKIAAGFGYLSEDRKSEGLAQDLSILENMTLSNLSQHSRVGWLKPGSRKRATDQLMVDLSVKAHSGSQAVSHLSGGNQQKVAIGRVVHQDADILLLDEPTKGIDVGTKSQIYELMGRLAQDGKTVVFVSSYLPELLAVCDRIAVMSRGELKEIRNTVDWNEESIMACATDVAETEKDESTDE